MKTPIAFFGVGLMGQPMAARLLAGGYPITVWNRTREKAEPLLASGARWAQTPTDAVGGAEVVVTMMTNGAAVESVLFDSGAAAAMAPGTIVIDMSTTSPPVAKDHAGRLAAHGVGYIDAPVSGGTRGATAGTLAIMAGGDAEAIARIAPIFAAMGTGRRVGPVGSGQLCKLANQLIVAVTIGAVAEALVLVEKGGADPVAVREALRGGFADSRILTEHGQRMLARDFKPGGTVNNQIKDLKAIEAFAESTGVNLPLLSTAHGLFEQLRSHFGGDMDHSSLFLEIERMATASARVGE